LNKVVAAGVAKPGTQGEELVVFVLHRGDMAGVSADGGRRGRLINEHTGLEVAQVIPVKRIPKTTSGKVQRHLLEKSTSTASSMRSWPSCRRCARPRRRCASQPARISRTRLQAICESALPGKRIDVHDNLFEIGASSLKLIEIHENIDREFPGLIDLTELFDHPTIAELAKHLESKIKREDPA
jgi:aryl carrier-like protein